MEFFIILFVVIIWYLKIYKNGIYCMFFYVVELFNKFYLDLFIILIFYLELENYFFFFMDVWKGNV